MCFSRSLTLVCEGSDEVEANDTVVVPGCAGRCRGTFTVVNDMNSTGWIAFNATLMPTSDPTSLAACHRLVGWMEGYYLPQELEDAAANLADATFPNSTLPPKVRQFLLDQWAYVQRQAQGDDGTFWSSASLWVSQLQGMLDGYAAQPQARLSLDSLLTLPWAGDLEDLIPALAERPAAVSGGRDCSALVRSPTPDLSSILVGHTTFNGYWCSLRVFRTLHFRAPSTTVSTPSPLPLPFSLQYSSRPGDLQSKDDFYVADSPAATLSVVETSLAACNHSAVFAGLTPRSAPCWLRALAATRAATSPSSWAHLFETENSGTHNNQWLISAPRPASLLLVEQMGRGPLASSDVTTILADQGFVGSYNTAYHATVAARAGCGATTANYTTAPRARIFARDAPHTASLTDIAHLMTSNNYRTDPISAGNPCRAISARCDLASSGATAFGGIDAKIVDLTTAPNVVLAISGMTTEGQPPFSFSPRWSSVPHRGIPEVFNFSWQSFVVASE
jgi:hypothetical protein